MNANYDDIGVDEIEGVINRLNMILGTSNDSELARRLNMPASTVSSWRNRVRMPHKVCLIVAKEHGVSMDWLYTGEGPMFSKLRQAQSDGNKTLDLLNMMLGRLVQIETKLETCNKSIEAMQGG